MGFVKSSQDADSDSDGPSPYRSLTRVHQLSACPYPDELDPAYGITVEEYWRAHVQAHGDNPSARRVLGDVEVDRLIGQKSPKSAAEGSGSGTSAWAQHRCIGCGWPWPLGVPPAGAECDNCGGQMIPDAYVEPAA